MTVDRLAEEIGVSPSQVSADGGHNCTGCDERWVRGKVLGSGSYGQVSTALDTRTGSLFAVKSAPVSLSSPNSRANIKALDHEIRVLKDLDSPYIVQYLGDSWTTEEKDDGSTITYRNLHLELAPGGSLAELLRTLGSQGLATSLLRKYTKDIVRALQYLHGRGIVHGDVKCLNVLIGQSCAKLADFGTARMAGTAAVAPGRLAAPSLIQDPKPQGLRGSPLWMSPETAGELGTQGTAVDVWSLGCTVLEMATGRAPWSEVDGGVHGVLYALGCTDTLPLIPDDIDSELRDFILSCLKRNPAERPTAVELLGHPFLTASSRAGSPSDSALDSSEDAEPPLERGQEGRETAPETVGLQQQQPQRRKRGRQEASFSEASLCCSENEAALPLLEPSTPSPTIAAVTDSPARSACNLAHGAKRPRCLTLPGEVSAEVSLREGECSTPSFPILEMASLKWQHWSFSSAGSWQQSPLFCSGKEWIVVRTP